MFSHRRGSRVCGTKLDCLGEEDGDLELVQALLDWMKETRSDYTRTFRSLSASLADDQAAFDDPLFISWNEALAGPPVRRARGGRGPHGSRESYLRTAKSQSRSSAGRGARGRLGADENPC